MSNVSKMIEHMCVFYDACDAYAEKRIAFLKKNFPADLFDAAFSSCDKPKKLYTNCGIEINTPLPQLEIKLTRLTKETGREDESRILCGSRKNENDYTI